MSNARDMSSCIAVLSLLDGLRLEAVNNNVSRITYLVDDFFCIFPDC